MSAESLIYHTAPKVTLLTNVFVNVPVILQYEDTPLIEVVGNAQLGYTSQIPIYHPDGTKLATTKGTRMFLTEDGKKAGLVMDKHPGMVACKLGTQTLFEIHNQPGDAFKTIAELYTPEGYFVKCADQPSVDLFNSSGTALQIGGLHMSGNTFMGCRIGILLGKNGSVGIAVS